MDDKHLGRAIESKYKGSHKKLVLIALCALIGALNFGLAIGYSSPAIPSMIKRGVLKKENSGWFGSLLTIGAIIGGPLGGWFIEKVGRKRCLTILSIPFSLGFFTIASSTENFQCDVGRFLTGIGSGMVTVCVPMYIAEISTTSIRGMLGSCVQLFVTVGIALAYILGMFWEWRWLAHLCTIPCVVGGILTFFIPETPRWLLLKKRKSDALKSLIALRDPHTDVSEECNALEVEGSDPDETISLSAMLKTREYSYPLLLVMCIMALQQMSGINAVMFYTVTIFETAVGEFAYTATVIIGIVQVLSTVSGVFLMDRAGRKKLLLFGGLLMAAMLFLFGLYYKLSSAKYLGKGFETWLPVVCLVLYMVGFSVGWGPVPMLIMSEMIPTKCKGTAGSVAIITSWGTAFLVTSQFTFLQQVIGNDGIFYLFSLWCIIAIWFVAKFLPETKGKSLEEIEMYFARKSTFLI